ncbi:MAG: prepilin-type N-terminal cleavage/methylation domain-containing protein [Pseudomonadales bacterium]
MKPFSNPKHAGFTLVEIAIVMVIFGLIIGGLFGPMKTQLENLDRRETLDTIDNTRAAIIGFAIRNGRIPCPDTDNDGLENRVGANCSNARGTAPWATLGVSQVDAWKRPLTYRVDTRFADSADGTGCPDSNVPGISFEVCSNGDISVFDQNGGNLVASGIPAVLVSHGKNWSGPGDSDEQENTDNDTSFVFRSQVNDGYDDLIGWVNLNNLIGKMVATNKLP